MSAWRALTGRRPGDFRLPAAGKDRQHVCGADSLRALGRDGPWLGSIGDTKLKAESLAGTVFSGAVGVGVRWPVSAKAIRTFCASSRNGCFLAARNTSGGIHPGRGVEE